MSSNYQMNKFYAQERVNAHQKAAQAHRRARQTSGRHSITRIAAAQVARAYNWTGRTIVRAVQGMVDFGKANVAARYPYIR